MFRKRVAVAVAAVSALALAGCGFGGSSDAASNGKVVLRLATPDSGPGAQHLQDVVDAYNKSQNHVVVKMEAYGDAFDQKLSSEIGAGQVPDILKMWDFPLYHSILIPLNDYINNLPDKDDFFPTLFNYAKMDGKIYGFPTGYSTRAIYYNTDLAKRAGLTPSPTWSSQDYATWVTKIGSLGGNVSGGDQPTNPDPYAFESFLFSNGGQWLDDAGKPVVNSPQNVQVIKFLHDLAYSPQTGRYVHKHPSSEDLSSTFMSGQLGTFEFGKWFTDTFTKNKTPYGILPMFSFNGKPPQSVVHASFLSVYKNTKHEKEVLDFITWFSSKANVTKAASYDLPVRKSVTESLGLAKDPINKPFLDVLNNSVGTTSSMLKNDKWPDISTDIAATLEAIFSNKAVDVQRQLDDLQKKLQSQ